MLADWLALVNADSDALVRADSEALVEADSDADVLAEAEADCEVDRLVSSSLSTMTLKKLVPVESIV